MALTVFPNTSQGIYNLGAAFTNAQRLVFHSFGLFDDTGKTGYRVGENFYVGSYEGFNTPEGIAVDADHDLMYIVDSSNYRISKYVVSTGELVGSTGYLNSYGGTCVSGTQGWCKGGLFTSTSAVGGTNKAVGITLDVANDLMYITDPLQSRVTKLVLSTGVFVGVIGNAAPSSTCSGPSLTGWCSNVGYTNPGSAAGQFQYSNSIAIDPAADRFYVVEGSNFRVQRFILSTGISDGMIGNSNAAGTCVAGKQTAWCTGGTFGTGTGNGMFQTAQAIAVDHDSDKMYVLDAGSNRIQKFTLSTGAFIGAIGNSTASGTCIAGKQTSWCTGGVFSSGTGDGQFNTARMISLDVANDLMYVGDAGNNRVQKFTLSTGAFIGAIGLSSASGTCSAGKQTSWCTGGVFSSGTGDGQFNTPSGVSFSVAANALFVADKINNRVQKFNLTTGAFVGSLGKATISIPNWTQTLLRPNSGSTDGLVSSATSIAIDVADDRMYVSDAGNNRIQKFVLSTGAFVGAIGNSTASGTCLSGKQNVWCTGGVFSSGNGPGVFNLPNGISLDTTTHTLYVADGNNYRVQKFDATTGAFLGAIGKSTVASGGCVVGVQTGWCTGGTFASGSAFDGGIANVRGVAVDPLHNSMYVIDSSFRVQKFNLSTGAFVGATGKSTAVGTNCTIGVQTNWCVGGTFSSANIEGAMGSSNAIALDVANDRFYIADNLYHRVQKFVLSTGAGLETLGRSTVAAGNCIVGPQTGWCSGGTMTSGTMDGAMYAPRALAVDAAHNFLYVSEGTNNRIQKFNLTTGAVIGSIGQSATGSGGCLVAGRPRWWCLGATFTFDSSTGGFRSAAGFVVDGPRNRMFLATSVGIQKISW